VQDSEALFIAILLTAGMVFIGAGTRSITIDDAVDNCIKANQDWTVATANAYCNSIIREGKRP
jgi:hypothetical protein